jgi:hypothetical protein
MLTYYTYAALSRSACALPLNLISGFETTSNQKIPQRGPVFFAGLPKGDL